MNSCTTEKWAQICSCFDTHEHCWILFALVVWLFKWIRSEENYFVFVLKERCQVWWMSKAVSKMHKVSVGTMLLVNNCNIYLENITSKSQLTVYHLVMLPCAGVYALWQSSHPIPVHISFDPFLQQTFIQISLKKTALILATAHADAKWYPRGTNWPRQVQ